MKSLEDLKKIREAAQNKMTMRMEDDTKYRVVVGMATVSYTHLDVYKRQDLQTSTNTSIEK